MTKRKKTILFFSLLALVLFAAGVWQGFRKTNSQKGRFKQYTVNRDDLDVSILSTGIVQPENRLEIKAPIAGRTEKVLVNEGTRVRKGQVLAWMSSTERAALIDAAATKGDAERAQWEEMYKPTAILAPINGMIIQRNIESGQTFTTQDAVFVMSDRLTVKAQVDETDIAKIKLKQEAEVVLDAYSGQKLTAHVDQIAFDAKTVNNVTTYLEDVLPDSPPEFLRSGMTANVTFKVNTKSDVLLIPAEAIKNVDGKNVVRMLGEDLNKPREQEIKVGVSDGKKIEVLAGLQENDVILIPEFKLETQRQGGSPFSPMGGAGGGGRRGR